MFLGESMAQIVQVQAQANVQWRAHCTHSRVWIGVCDPMNLSVQASSLDELHSVINETMNLLFLDLLVDNELDRFLKDHGWKVARIPQKVAGSEEDIKFDVPWELIADGQGRACDSERRAR